MVAYGDYRPIIITPGHHTTAFLLVLTYKVENMAYLALYYGSPLEFWGQPWGNALKVKVTHKFVGLFQPVYLLGESMTQINDPDQWPRY